MRLWWLVMVFNGWLNGATEAVRWVELDPADLPAPWSLIVDEQRAKEQVQANFVEERSSRLRRRPALFKGDLIFSREEGLSLRYAAAVSSIVVLDAEGIVRRSIEGERNIPVSDGMGGLPQLFLELFALDLEALQARFTVEGQLLEDGWSLRFVPLAATAETLGIRFVVLEGSDGWVREIGFDRMEGMRLRIRLSNHAVVEALSQAVREERFR